MRRLLLSSATVIAACLSAGPVAADPKPAWVDPPAKPAASEAAKDTTRNNAGEVTKPVAPEARAPEGQAEGADDAAEARTARRHRPHRSAETRRERRLAVRAGGRHARAQREAAAPSPATPAAGPGAGAPPNPHFPASPHFPEWAAASQRLTEDYLDTVSASNAAMVAAAPRFYAERVRFHGRTLPLGALIAEKQRFVRRWPERRYEPQAGSMRTACHAASATCVVQVTFDFTAENPARGVRSQGVSALDLTISFANGRPVIVSESSRVLSRYGSVSAAGRPARGA